MNDGRCLPWKDFFRGDGGRGKMGEVKNALGRFSRYIQLDYNTKKLHVDEFLAR